MSNGAAFISSYHVTPKNVIQNVIQDKAADTSHVVHLALHDSQFKLVFTKIIYTIETNNLVHDIDRKSVQFLNNVFHTVHIRFPADENNHGRVFDTNDVRDFGNLLKNKNAGSREQAILVHLILTEYGMDSQVCKGSVNVNGNMLSGHFSHAWVEVSCPNDNLTYIIDAAKGIFCLKSDYTGRLKEVYPEAKTIRIKDTELPQVYFTKRK